MKSSQKDIQTLKLDFTLDELKLLDRVIEVPLSAFGLDELLEKTKLKLDEIKLLKQRIESSIKDNSYVLYLSPQEFVNLKNIFKVASDIVDPDEIHTLTGYSWEEALNLQKSLN